MLVLQLPRTKDTLDLKSTLLAPLPRLCTSVLLKSRRSRKGHCQAVSFLKIHVTLAFWAFPKPPHHKCRGYLQGQQEVPYLTHRNLSGVYTVTGKSPFTGICYFIAAGPTKGSLLLILWAKREATMWIYISIWIMMDL